MRRLLALTAAALIAVITVTGCAKKEETPAEVPVQEEAAAAEEVERPPKGNKPELVVALPSDISGLNPMTSASGVNANCLTLTHETLFVESEDGIIEPFLAAGAEWTSDTTFDVVLRNDVFFSNGTQMTSNDVVHTFETAKGLHHGAIAPLLTGIESVEAVTEDRVVFHTNAYMEDMESLLANMTFAVQSLAAYETGMQNPYLVGTGPYVFADRVNGRYTSFKKNDNYWGADEGASARISFYAIPEQEERVQALKALTADVILVHAQTATEEFGDDVNVRVYAPTGAEYAVVYRKDAVFPYFTESDVQHWAGVYVVLE